MLNKKVHIVLISLLLAVFSPNIASAALQGVGSTRTCPDNGSIESSDDIWIHSESWPVGAGSGARVVYTTNNITWTDAAMSSNGRLGQHDWWLVNLGSFPAGTFIRFAVEVYDVGGGSQWDSNGGSDYVVTVNGGAPSRSVNNTSFTPPNGQIGSDSVITVTAQSSPLGEASSARLEISQNQGWSWYSVTMNHAGTSGNNDIWSAQIGPFPAATTNMFAVEVSFDNPEEKIWDTNNGANHQVVVNMPFAGQWIGNARHTPPSGDIDVGDNVTLNIEARPQGKVSSARAVWTSDGNIWNSSAMSYSGVRDSNDWWSVNIGSFAAGTIIQYAFEVNFGSGGKVWDTNFGANYLAVVNSGGVQNWAGNTEHFPASGDIDPEDNLWINSESKPVGTATAANLVYSINGGNTWTSAPMSLAGLRNGNDHWNVNLGMFSPGTVVEYAVQVLFPGQTIWDNNAGKNFKATVNSPDPVGWVGNTYNYPNEGAIDPNTQLWINTETLPSGAATSVNVLFSINDGLTWSNVALAANGTSGGKDLWHVNLGGFPEGTIVRYAVNAVGEVGGMQWDSNGGEDYYVRVHSLIRDVYTDKARYNPGDTANIAVELYYANGTNPVNAQVQVRVMQLFTNIASFTTNITMANWSGTNLNFAWTVPQNDFRGYGIDVDLLVSNVIRDRRSSAIDVSTDWTKYPRYGFFSDYYDGEQANDSSNKVKALSKYHINAAQFYDWMWEHDRLIKYDCEGKIIDLYEQIDGRIQSFKSVSNKVAAAWTCNMFPMAYSLVYGDSGIGEAPTHPEWAAYTQPWATTPNLVRQHNLSGFNPPRAIWVMDVSNPEWKGFIINQYKDALTKLNFGGMHLDNLGGSWNYRYNSDSAIFEWIDFPSFINDSRTAIREVRGDARVIHNDVAGNYLNDIARSQEDVYYMEVWGNEHYRDIQNVIRNAKSASGGSKQVVLAAYMNLFNYSNYVSEASVRLMDAATFANGAFRIELGEGIEYLTNHYFPMHWPPARESLKRALRYYYSFIVRYENLLFFNTLGNVIDATEQALTYSATDALSKDGQSGTIWTVIKQWKDEFDTISLINLYGVDTEWRNRSARPPPRSNVHFKYYVDKDVQQVYIATPDDGLGRPMELPFIEGTDGLGNFIEVTVPRLDYWSMLILDKRTDIKVDGWPGDWQAASPTGVHQVTVASGEWVYKGDVNDHRTFGGAGVDSDITEVRFTCDETYAYFLVRMQNINDASAPALGIAWNAHTQTPGDGHQFIGDASTPSTSIGLENSDQFATRQIMVYTPTAGSPTIRLWNGGIWYSPPAGDSAVVVSTADDAIEFRINKNDLDLFYPSKITMTMASFRSSGNHAGSDATFDSPDNNNDAIDLLGGDPGVSENAWGRDLNNNGMARHYQLILNEQGAAEVLEIPWPNYDGQKIDLGPLGVYTLVARFSESLPANKANFTLKIDGVTQTNSALYFLDNTPGDFMNEIRFDWTDNSSEAKLIEWWYDHGGRHLYASRSVILNPDTDSDGILDFREDVNRDGQIQLNETDANSKDTDGDELADGYEDGNKNGFVGGDANSNFLYDAGELWTETDPRNADTDGDGLSDGWEVIHGFNPWDNGIPGHTNMNTGLLITNELHGARGDPDNDGINNSDEQRSGTNPHDINSHLHIIDMELLEGQGSELIWSSVSGKQYRVYATPTLMLPFQPVNNGTPVLATSDITLYQANTDQPPVRFYQLRLAY